MGEAATMSHADHMIAKGCYWIGRLLDVDYDERQLAIFGQGLLLPCRITDR